MDEEARADIKWWRDFIRYWNGKEIIQPQPVTSVDLGLYTDASNAGMGGVSGNKWFYFAWEKAWEAKHINVEELFAIVTAIFAWGKEWRDMSIVLYTDNKPITQIWHTGATQNKEMMCLIRYLLYCLAQRNVNIRLEHVYGYNNRKADYLSRLQVKTFKETTPTAEEDATPIPPEVWDILPECETPT